MNCCKCKRQPNAIDEYVECAEDMGVTPDEYVRREEGTLNHRTGEFWCTECYIAVGQPLGTL